MRLQRFNVIPIKISLWKNSSIPILLKSLIRDLALSITRTYSNDTSVVMSKLGIQTLVSKHYSLPKRNPLGEMADYKSGAKKGQSEPEVFVNRK